MSIIKHPEKSVSNFPTKEDLMSDISFHPPSSLNIPSEPQIEEPIEFINTSISSIQGKNDKDIIPLIKANELPEISRDEFEIDNTSTQSTSYSKNDLPAEKGGTNEMPGLELKEEKITLFNTPTYPPTLHSASD